ncbi:hypothetical protein ABZW11_26185 [Nonomuraea sp. NPDC004580]
MVLCSGQYCAPLPAIVPHTEPRPVVTLTEGGVYASPAGSRVAA